MRGKWLDRLWWVAAGGVFLSFYVIESDKFAAGILVGISLAVLMGIALYRIAKSGP